MKTAVERDHFSEAVTPAQDPAAERDQRAAFLRRLRARCEAQMTPDFNLPLSRLIDDLVQQEEALSPLSEEGKP